MYILTIKPNHHTKENSMYKKKAAPQERGAEKEKYRKWVNGALLGLAVMIVIDLAVIFACCKSPEDVLQVISSLILLSVSLARCLALKNEK